MGGACLVDASPYIFRAYFSLPVSLSDPCGRPVNAVYGFAEFLLKLIREERPSHLAVAFDGSLTTSFRNQIYPDYKAGRELPPAELEAQLDDCRELTAAMGCAVFIDDRYEADDLIATLCRLLAGRLPVAIVTPDKDLCQLVGEGVELLDAARGERYDPGAVRARFGVGPGQIPDYLGLAGDPVDSIPGVRGIGRKIAAALLAALPDLEAIYDDLERVAALPLRGASGIAEKLRRERETAFLSRRLARLADDAPVAVRPGDLELGGADPARLDRLSARLGFGDLGQRLAVAATGRA